MRLYDSHIHLDKIERLPSFPKPHIYKAMVPGIVPDATLAYLDTITAAGHRAGVALHPWYLGEEEPSGALWASLVEAASDPRVAAVGETGLDRYKHRDAITRARAVRWFEAHARLAADLNKPMIIHCVRAHGECLEVLRSVRPPAGGVVHAFSGSVEVMQAYDKLGFRVGIGVAVTRARSTRVRAAALAAPAEQLLIETDAPFMALDGQESGLPVDIIEVAHAVAALRGESVEALAEQTWLNAARLFG